MDAVSSIVNGATGGGGAAGGVSDSQAAALADLERILTQALVASTKSSEIQADKNTARKVVDGAAVR